MSVYKPKNRPSYRIAYTAATGKRQYVYGIPTAAMARDLEAQMKFAAKAARLGLLNPKADRYALAAGRKLVKHLDEYIAHLKAMDRAPQHVRETRRAIEITLEDASIDRLDQLDRVSIVAACDRVLSQGLSRRTRNKQLAAMKSWCAWLFDQERIQTNMLARATMLDDQQDRKRVRRVASDEEIARLIATTRSGPERGGMSGEDRAMRYLLGIGTGFRQGTLWKLQPEAFHLDENPPYIHVEAKQMKSRKMIDHPLNAELAAAIAPWLATKPAGRPIFTCKSGYHPQTAYKQDLAAAGIIYHQEGTNQYFDQHAHRNVFITAVIRATGNLAVAQDLAHHSTPVLTKRYARLGMDDYSKALAAPPPGTPKPAARPEQNAAGAA